MWKSWIAGRLKKEKGNKNRNKTAGFDSFYLQINDLNGSRYSNGEKKDNQET